MTFSEFAKLLYPYCGNGSSHNDYVVLLTDKIMQGRPGQTRSDGDYQNPMRNKSRRLLQAYFSGERPISKRTASIIFSSIDKYKFEQFLRGSCSDNAQDLLREEISKATNTVDNKDIAEICADLFEDILHALATK